MNSRNGVMYNNGVRPYILHHRSTGHYALSVVGSVFGSSYVTVGSTNEKRNWLLASK